MNLRVAIVEPVGGHGGMDYYDFGLSGGLAAVGVDVVLHTCDKTVIPEHEKFDVQHTYRGIFNDAAAWRRGLRFILGSLKVIGLSVLEKRKIVHFHFFHVGGLALMNVLLARIMFRRVVITAHDVESFVAAIEVPLMSRVAYSLAHAVIAHNRISRDELVNQLAVPAEKIAIIPHGNYLHALKPLPPVEAARAKLGIPVSAKVLLFFGQIKDVKGLDILLNAMPAVLQQHSDAILLIAGKTWKTDFGLYKKIIDRLGINDACITHIRYILDDEVPLYYGASDLVVLPYRHIYQSGVVLMAMSYGKAVLVSDIQGMVEVVGEQAAGYVFRAEDAHDLARSICSILEDPVGIQTMSKKGYELISREYDWCSIGQKTKAVYEKVVS